MCERGVCEREGEGGVCVCVYVCVLYNNSIARSPLRSTYTMRTLSMLWGRVRGVCV